MFFEQDQIKIVSSFSELVNSDFSGITNAMCWNRNLQGNFEEIVSLLSLQDNITEVDNEDLLALKLSASGLVARDTIIKDLQLLTDFGASPALNLIRNYDRDEEFDFISTDVYSYHVDQSPIATSTFLCTYFGAASNIVPNHQATQKIAIPEIREKLKKFYSGTEDEFEDFLVDNYFDLHYQPEPDADFISLGTGNLWKLAVDHPGQKVLPCIHCAPKENDGEYRLLLIC